MEKLAYILNTGNLVSSIIKAFKILFIYEDYSVIEKVNKLIIFDLQAFDSLKNILVYYKITNEDLFSLAMELFERKYTKSIISAIWIIVRLTDHIPTKLWSKCKGVIEELIKKKKLNLILVR